MHFDEPVARPTIMPILANNKYPDKCYNLGTFITNIDLNNIIKPSSKFAQAIDSRAKFLKFLILDEKEKTKEESNTEYLIFDNESKISMSNIGFAVSPKFDCITEGSNTYRLDLSKIVDKFIEDRFRKGDGLYTHYEDMVSEFRSYFGSQLGFSGSKIVDNFIKNYCDKKLHCVIYNGLTPIYSSVEKFLTEGIIRHKDPFYSYKLWCRENNIVPYDRRVVYRKLKDLSENAQYAKCANCNEIRKLCHVERLTTRCGIPMICGKCNHCDSPVKYVDE